MKVEKPFVLMVKPVGSLCNLRCGYCYYLQTDTGKGGVMPPDVLESLIKEYFGANPGPIHSFTWHGGEPALAGLSFYQTAVELQKRYLPDGHFVWNNLQTNGLLLDDDFCAFLAKEKFDVGISVDGDAVNHDLYRIDAAGNSTYAQAVASIKRLQSAGIQPDLLCTVTSDAAKRPSEIYRALRDLDTGWIQFIPIVRFLADGSLTKDSVMSEGYGAFLRAIFDEWAFYDIGKLDVQIFAEMSLVLSGREADLCWMMPECGRALVIERDGAVYSCDHFVDGAHRLGAIGDGLAALVDGAFQRDFGRQKANLSKCCVECDALPFCNGGCPKDRLPDGRNVLCEGLVSAFRYAKKPLERIGSLKEQGRSPQSIMAELTAMASARWKGVGRNDPCPCGSGKKAKQCCLARPTALGL